MDAKEKVNRKTIQDTETRTKHKNKRKRKPKQTYNIQQNQNNTESQQRIKERQKTIEQTNKQIRKRDDCSMATLNACTTSTVDYTALLPAPKMD